MQKNSVIWVCVISFLKNESVTPTGFLGKYTGVQTWTIVCPRFSSCAQVMDKKTLEDRIITLSRSALKPHYHGGRITAQEYKTIMKKAIAKVHCSSNAVTLG